MILPDDPSILDSDVLFRRLREDWIIESDTGDVYISSAAFRQDGPIGEISVNIERLTSLAAVLGALGNSESLGATNAGFPRSLEYAVAVVEELGNPGHAHLYPPSGSRYI